MHEGHGRGRTRSLVQPRCPACAEALTPGARVCASCGERRASWRPRRSLPERATRSPGLAAALAAIFPGAGHLYCERIAAGLAIIFVFPIGLSAAAATLFSTGAAVAGVAGLGGAYLLVVALAFGGYAWQIHDAYASARPSPARFALRRRQPRRAARARSAQAPGGSPGGAAPR